MSVLAKAAVSTQWLTAKGICFAHLRRVGWLIQLCLCLFMGPVAAEARSFHN